MWTDDELTIVRLSLWVATWATLGSLPPAIGVAFLLSRTRFPGRSLVSGLVHLPLVLPPVVTGYVLLRVFGRHGAVGAPLEETLGVVFAFRWTGAALAAAVMGFPLMANAVRIGLDAVDRRLEDAAGTLGASPAWTFVTVTLPLVTPSILAGVVLAFAKALGEFGATITFVSNIPGETQTLALAIYTFTQTPDGDAQAARLVVLSILLSLAALLVSEALGRRVTRRARQP